MSRARPSSPAGVLYVVEGLGLSGKTRALVSLACELDRDRYRPAVCYLNEEDSPLCARLTERGVPLFHAPCREGLDPRSVLSLLRVIREVRPHVVHCFNQRAMLYAGLAAHLSGIHATVGSLSAFACQMPDRTYDFLPQPLGTVSRKNRVRNRVVSRLMSVLVAVSKRLGQSFCRFNGVPEAQVRVISYAANIEELRRCSDADVARMRARIGVRPGEILVGSVGRLVEQKDYPTQLHAFARAAQIEPRLRMVLAGGGPLHGQLTEMTRALGIADRVTLLGHITEVPLVLRALDVFVLASQFEPYGVAILEAKAAGLPIVATRVNELPEILGEGRSGLLVERRQPEAMANALVTLARDADLRKKLGHAALTEACEHHSLEKTVARYQGLYDEVQKRGLAGLVARTRPADSAIARSSSFSRVIRAASVKRRARVSSTNAAGSASNEDRVGERAAYVPNAS